MGKSTKIDVRLKDWVYSAVDEIRIAKELDLSKTINMLLSDELEHLGYSQTKFEMQNRNLHRDDDGETPKQTGGLSKNA